MGLGALLFVAAVLFFYSGGLLDPAGLKGLYQTFGRWYHTGKAGNGHSETVGLLGAGALSPGNVWR